MRLVVAARDRRASSYRTEQVLPCPVLCDPDGVAYRAFGIGQWRPERVMFAATDEHWRYPHNLGDRLLNDRWEQGRPLVNLAVGRPPPSSSSAVADMSALLLLSVLRGLPGPSRADGGCRLS